MQHALLGSLCLVVIPHDHMMEHVTHAVSHKHHYDLVNAMHVGCTQLILAVQ